jgi:membrane-bound lytic murein transglycosylase B
MGGAVVLAVAMVMGGSGTLAAQGADEAIVVEDARLHPSLAGVQVSGTGRSDAVTSYRSALGRLEAARADLAGTAAAIDQAAAQRAALAAEMAAAATDRAAAEAASTRLRASLRSLAVERYTRGGSAPVGAVDLEAVDAELRQQAVVNTVLQNKQDDLRSALITIDRTTATLAEGQLAEERLTAELTGLESTRSSQEGQVIASTAEAERARRTAADWRLGADVAGSDIPLVVLDAYVKAAETMGRERPECAIRWWALAGIGWAESRHATQGGSRPGADGVTTRQIIGIPLDGTNDTAAIGDTDGGFLDGDPVVDRAVGPMQFIPGTWRSQGRDGSLDGRADPHNVYDAALSAAGLLCRSGGAGLDQAGPLRRAALGYNASGYYADLVVSKSFEYAARADALIPPPPIDPALLAFLAGLTPPPPGLPPGPPAPAAPISTSGP